MSLSNLSVRENTQVSPDYQTAILCVPCSTLDIQSLLLGQEVNHHTSYSSLLESARNGCELCTLVSESNSFFKTVSTKTVFGDPNLPTKARFIVGEAYKPEFSSERITPQTPITKLAFYTEGEEMHRYSLEAIRVCTTRDDPLCDIVEHRRIESDCGSHNGLQVAISWLQKCLTSHHSFCNNVESSLPKRVIYIGQSDTTSDPYLLETDNEIGAWVALSHCWGQGTSFTTTTTNILDREKGIPFADFPATFRDAITISRRLGIEHLWIDSLCIIQDSASDWLEQSGQMKQVYSNATVTLVAEASEDSHSGIFTSANAGRAKTIHIPFHDGTGNYRGSLYSQKYAESVHPIYCYAPGPLNSRAWALQEDVLSQRILRYASDQLFWSCHTSFHPESDPFVFHEYQAFLDPRNFRRQAQSSETEIEIKKVELLSFWYTIVVQYRKRRLTFEKDKFPALSGIAMEMAERIKYTYVAGLWLEDIHAGLLWSTVGTICRRSPEYVAPSWSWACITQLSTPHSYPHFPSHDTCGTRMNIAEIVRVDVSTVGGDPYGQVTSGILRIRGPSKNIPYYNAEKHYPAGMRRHFDVGKEELDSDILCMQILEAESRFGASWGIYSTEPRSTFCILLKPTSQVEEYQRIGVADIDERSLKLEEAWELREVTVI